MKLEFAEERDREDSAEVNHTVAGRTVVQQIVRTSPTDPYSRSYGFHTCRIAAGHTVVLGTVPPYKIFSVDLCDSIFPSWA